MNWAELSATMARMEAERAAATRTARASLVGQLRALQVSRVEASYDGYGDSGNIEGVSLSPEGITLDPDLSRSLTDFLWDVAYNLHPGFENNDGAYGEITWDIVADRINVSHNARFTDVNSSEHEDV